MPKLYYGRIDGSKRQLYGINLRPIEVDIFDEYKIKHLAPSSKRPFVAHLWHLMECDHTIAAWYDDRGKEHSLVVPGFHSHIDMAMIMHEDWKGIKPDATVFRWHDEYRVLRYYDD